LEGEENISLSRKRLDYLAAIDPQGMDIQIFQGLPVYIRKRVLKEGKLKYCRDKERLYELAYKTVKEYEYFAPWLREYLEGLRDD